MCCYTCNKNERRSSSFLCVRLKAYLYETLRTCSTDILDKVSPCTGATMFPSRLVENRGSGKHVF